MERHAFIYKNNGNKDSGYENSQNTQNAIVLHSRVATHLPLSRPLQPQSSTTSGGGGGPMAVKGQVAPRSDAISNRTSLPSTSLLPITNPDPGMTSKVVNYQYDPVPAEGYDMPAMPLELPQHLTYMQQGYAQNLVGPNTPKYNGRPMDNTMAVLSSEQYDDRGASRRSVRRQQEPMIPLFGLVEQPRQKEEVPVRKSNNARQSHDSESGAGERRRKKQKLSSEDEGDDDAAKKARGRPRLDTKDETAADRRRTQIRMAQRAYRHRKETTISSLEKQVQELRNANEQMSNIFINLHDYAVGRGLLQREPEFGNRLKSTTERFLALVKSVSSDENSKDDDGTSQDGSKPSHSEADLENVNNLEESEQKASQAPQPEILPALDASIWGYQVTGDDNRDNQMNQIDWNQQPYIGTSRQDHQIISRATFDNASFGIDLFDNDNLQLFRAEVPEVNDYQSLTTFQESLPLIQTLAHHESSFGRHLHRAALECGFKLITAKNAPPAIVNSIFGFCLRFETREDIAMRLKRAMETSSKDSLQVWNAPFVHLGGSGTYYQQNETQSEPMMPKLRTGMSMGPFSSPVINARETAMFDDFQINMPGFEGEFFDSYDVEGYLRGRGIDIPPNVEFVTVDLDQLSMPDMPSPGSRSDSSTIKPYSPETPRSPEVRFTELAGQDSNIASQMDDFVMNISNNDVDMNFFSFPPPEWNTQDQTKNSENLLDLTGPIFNSAPISQDSTNVSNSENLYQERHLVTLSVTILVQELVKKTKCLGRAPGFRPMDVESALRRALQQAF